MILQLFFENLLNFKFNKSKRNSNYDRAILYDQISINTENFPNWKDADIAIIGIQENRGEGIVKRKNAKGESSKNENINVIRQQLYNLTFFSKDCHITDLGNLRQGDVLKDTYQRLREVCHILINHNTLPVIIGGSHDLDFGQFQAYENLNKIITILNIDAYIDLQLENRVPSFSHIHQILLHEPNFLLEYNHLGFQRYLVEKTFLDTLSKLNFDILSIGEMRENFHEIEPIIRNADMMSFDISAIRNFDVAISDGSPFGLTGEEASQICWYAGLNEKLTSVGIYGIKQDVALDQKSALTIAIMIWYFIEGFTHRKQEYSFKSNFHTKYIVPFEDLEQELIFYKSKITEKWWLEVSLHQTATETFNRNIIVPCSYTDYETANKGILPNRWLKALEKL